VLALITASAVGVERILEVFWALMGLSGRPWWPFTSIGYQVQDLVKNLNTTLEPLRDRAQEGLSRVGDASGRIAEEFPNLQQVNRLTENLDTVTPPNPQAREIADAAKRSAGWFKEHESDLRGAATKVQAAAETLSSFLDTFKDNPARRLISICLGSIIGVIVAGMLGLDALKATLGTTPPYVVGWFPNAGTAVTGLVIGLGANPTHELIKTLQETKQNRRSA
jgi:hypothetical protein